MINNLKQIWSVVYLYIKSNVWASIMYFSIIAIVLSKLFSFSVKMGEYLGVFLYNYMN